MAANRTKKIRGHSAADFLGAVCLVDPRGVTFRFWMLPRGYDGAAGARDGGAGSGGVEVSQAHRETFL